MTSLPLPAATLLAALHQDAGGHGRDLVVVKVRHFPSNHSHSLHDAPGSRCAQVFELDPFILPHVSLHPMRGCQGLALIWIPRGSCG